MTTGEVSKARMAIKQDRGFLEASKGLSIYEPNGNFDWIDTDQPTDRWAALCQLCEEPFVIGDGADLPLASDNDLFDRLYKPLVMAARANADRRS
jgi:hypothetical protein